MNKILHDAFYHVPENRLITYLEMETNYLNLGNTVQMSVKVNDYQSALDNACDLFRVIDKGRWRLYQYYVHEFQNILHMMFVWFAGAGLLAMVVNPKPWKLYFSIIASGLAMLLRAGLDVWMSVLQKYLARSRSDRMMAFVQRSLRELGMNVNFAEVQI